MFVTPEMRSILMQMEKINEVAATRSGDTVFAIYTDDERAELARLGAEYRRLSAEIRRELEAAK